MRRRDSVVDDRLQVVETPGVYVYFVLSAFAITLVGGPIVGVILWASRSGIAFADRQPAIIQAHGWTQLLGWAGLFVAGFSLRLLPRFAGRPEGSTGLSLALLGALVCGALLRLLGEVLGGPARALAAAGEVLAAAGICGIAVRQVAVLRNNRNPGAPWALLAWIGAGWWGIWAVLTLVGAAVTAESGTVPFVLDRATVWTVTLGAVGNFIWAVQSRMMPVSFGRRALTRASVSVPILAYNLGAAAALLAAIPLSSGQMSGGWPEIRTAGLGVAGAGMIWLAFTCGATHGRPSRLRPASQPLALLIIWANRWAVVGGVLLLLLSMRSLLPPAVARLDLEDAALHAIEVGLITLLIAGMLQLVAPVFAMARVGPQPRERFVVLVWALLMTATLSRVSAAFVPAAFDLLAGISGVAGWLALGLLALALVRARRDQTGPSAAANPRLG
jgi:NnrS protein